MLTAQRRTPPLPLDLDIDADKRAEHTVRADLHGWLSQLAIGFNDGQILEHAVSEFVANSVEHAYATTAPGNVTVDADPHVGPSLTTAPPATSFEIGVDDDGYVIVRTPRPHARRATDFRRKR